MGFNSFRWPVAYYGSNNASGHQLYMTVWPLINTFSLYDFKMHGIMMDCSSNNHQFTRLVINAENAWERRYTTVNPYDVRSQINIIQDCKHIFIKIKFFTCKQNLSQSQMSNNFRWWFFCSGITGSKHMNLIVSMTCVARYHLAECSLLPVTPTYISQIDKGTWPLWKWEII